MLSEPCLEYLTPYAFYRERRITRCYENNIGAVELHYRLRSLASVIIRKHLDVRASCMDRVFFVPAIC